MTIVFRTLHFHLRPGEVHDCLKPSQELKLLGTYSTRARAEAAIARMRDKEGFRDWPAGFRIIEMEIDHTNWEDGFEAVPGAEPG